MATTVLANLIDPQVLADFIDEKLTDNMVFAPLATVDTLLEGRPGSTVTMPKWVYIGAASTVGENSAIPISSITQSSASVAIHKIAKGTEFTDEAALSGYGDISQESGMQLVTAIADGLDGEMLGILGSIASNMTHTCQGSTALAADDINDAFELFGEDVDDGPKILLVNPADATKLRKADSWLPASEIAAGRMVRGAIGEIYGCQVIITNRLKNFANGRAFIVKPGALRLFLKRDTLVEADRDIVYKKTVLTADKHFACYLYNEKKAIKLVLA